MYKSEGYLHEVDVSCLLSYTASGKASDLHMHPYDEVLLVQEGELTFTVGDATVEAT